MPHSDTPRPSDRRRFLTQVGTRSVATAWLAGQALPALAEAPTPTSAQALPTSSRAGGIAVPIGGALRYDNDEVWSRLVQLAGGPGARFAVFATAAGNPERSAQLIGRALSRHGATAEHIAVAPRLAGTNLPEAVRDERWIKAVLSCQGVFFAGGAQERITDTLQLGGQRSPLLDAVWQVFNRGGVVAGTSAGAAIMSRLMFRDAQSVMGVLRGDLRMGKEIDQGLGFVGPALFIDQHFLKRGRIGRMLPLMQSQGYRWGLGVEENSAAIVQGGRIEVIGARGALLADLADATQDARLGAFNLRGATLSLLERGDRYDLAQRQFTPSATKQAEGLLNAQAPGFKPYFNDRPFHLDILGDNTIAQAMAHLIDNTASEVRGLACEAQSDQRLGFEFRLYKAPDSLGWFSAAAGGEDYSVAHLRLDVQPVRMAPTLYSPWSS